MQVADRTTRETAREIAEDGLVRLERVIADPAPEAISDLFARTVNVVSDNRVHVLTETGAVREMLAEIAGAVRARGATRFERVVKAARFETPDHAYALHVTTWFSAEGVVAGPFSTMVSYRKCRTGWKISRIQVSRAAPSLLADSLGSHEAASPDGHVKARVEHAVEALSAAMLSGDRDSFAQYTRGPFVLQRDEQVEVLETRRDFDTHLDSLSDDLKRRNVTEIVRFAKNIQVLGREKVMAHCVTYLLSGDQLILSSYSNNLCCEAMPGQAWAATALVNPRRLMRA